MPAAVVLIAGCGQTGAPLSPSLQLPNPVTDLTATRIADHVSLKWTMPRRTTDKLPLKGLQRVRICRRTGDGMCRTVATVTCPPDKPGAFDDILPSDLTAGAPRLLVYSVDVLSPHGRSAGSSNVAQTATGPAPPPFTRAKGEISADGVVLQWQAESIPAQDNKIEIERKLLSAPRKSAGASSFRGFASAPANQQTLVVRMPTEGDSGRALDSDAAFDQLYSYRISRMSTVTVDGKSIDLLGQSSQEIVVHTKDTFPPAAPVGLAAVAETDAGAIDLSWSPDLELDLAGYAIYRSESGQKAVRISSPEKPLETPAFRDTTAQPEHLYTYSVTAIDRDGNESPRSAGVDESFPARQ